MASAIINVLYGFAKIIQSGQKSRLKVIIVQSVSTAIFLGLCILACFTAFYRDGEIIVSSLSAFIMSLFFILLGVTVGTYIASFLQGKRKSIFTFASTIGAITPNKYKSYYYDNDADSKQKSFKFY